MTRLVSGSLWLCLLLSPAAFAQDQESEAGDVNAIDREAGPLRDRIRPVSGYLFLKQGRLELSPAASVTVRDSFFAKYVFGGSVSYHLLETFAISGRFGYAIPTVSSAAQVCTVDSSNNRTCQSPTFAQLDGVAPGQMNLLIGGEVQWSPLYGKLAMVAEQFMHFDLYAIGGIMAVAYKGPAVGQPSQSMMAPGLNLGAGMRVFLNRWLSVRGELCDLIYSETTITSPSLRQQLSFQLGVSVFFPFNFSEPT